jgi:hypothetical protein
MKKLFIAAILSAVACLLALAADSTPAPIVLSTSTANGITTTITVGRVQTKTDGVPGTYTIYPTVTKTVGGTVIISGLSTARGTPTADSPGPFDATLSAAQVVALAGTITAAYTAANP